jgi:hypothetical protein
VTTSPVTWRSRPFPQRHRLGRIHSRTADKRVLPGGVERIKAGNRAEAFLSQAASYLSVEGGGHAGEGGARRGLRHDGARLRRVEGGKLEGESCWKSSGGRTRLIAGRVVGLADEARSDAIPDAAGGEGGHGTAKPHGVIHRYIFNQ